MNTRLLERRWAEIQLSYVDDQLSVMRSRLTCDNVQEYLRLQRERCQLEQERDALLPWYARLWKWLVR